MIIQIISCSSYIYLYYLYKYIWLVIRWYNIYLWNHYGAPMTLLQCLEWVCWRTSVTFATSETLQNWAHLGQLVVPECPYFRCLPQKRFFITNLMTHETNYQKFSILNTQAKSTLLKTLALNIVKKNRFSQIEAIVKCISSNMLVLYWCYKLHGICVVELANFYGENSGRKCAFLSNQAL